MYCVYKSQGTWADDSIQPKVAFFCLLGPGALNSGIELGGKALPPLSHLSDSEESFETLSETQFLGSIRSFRVVCGS